MRSRTSRALRNLLPPGLLLCAAVLTGPVAGMAQEVTSSSLVQYQGASTVSGSVLPTTSGQQLLITLDHLGNLILADVVHEIVIKVPADGGNPTTLAAGLPGVAAITADRSGNVYIATNTLDHLVEIPSGSNTPVNLGSGLLQPSSLGIDPQGNIIVADTGNNRVVGITPAGSLSVLNASIASPTAVFSDPSGNLFIANSSSIHELPSGGNLSQVSSGFTQLSALSADEYGNLFALDLGAHQIVEVASSTGNKNIIGSSVTTNPSSMVTNGEGTLYAYDLTAAQIASFSTDTKIDIGNAIVGTATSSYTLTYSFLGDVKLASILTLTQGLPDGQLKMVGGTCLTDYVYQQGESCTVIISATLKQGGSWNGDVSLISSSGANLLDTEVFATGQAPVLALFPGNASTFYFNQGSYLGGLIPSSLAVDSSDNVYIGDDGTTRVLQVAPNGSSQVIFSKGTVISGTTLHLGSPLALTLDGKGDLYVADESKAWGISPNLGAPASQQSDIFTAIPYGQWGYSLEFVDYMNGLVIQPDGGFFFSDTENNRVVFINPAKQGTEAISRNTPIGSDGLTLNYPTSLAYDNYGNLLIVDTGNSRIVKRTAAGALSELVSPSTLLAGLALSAPTGIAADAAGNVYISDTGNDRIVGITPLGATFTVIDATSTIDGTHTTPLNNPQTITLDSHGNLYVADVGNERVLKITRNQQTLFFNQTNPGSQSTPLNVSVQNIGNQPLTLQSMGVTAGSAAFDLSSASTCQGSQSLPADSSCTLQLAFAPTSLSNYQGQLSITSNTQNITGTSTAIQLAASSEVSVNDLKIVTLPTDVTAGSAFTYGLRAEDAQGNLETGYVGTVQIAWSDKSVAPLTYTFTAADAGLHSFNSQVLHTAGFATLTATDTQNKALTATASLLVSPGSAATINIKSGSGQVAPIGTAFSQPLSVIVNDAYGNIVPGATVNFTAPASGASATNINGSLPVQLPTDSTGTAYLFIDANNTAGSYAIPAALASGPSVAFSLTNEIFGFNLKATPSTTFFDKAGVASTTLTITPLQGFSGTVSLTCAKVNGVACNFSNTNLQIEAHAQTDTTDLSIPVNLTIKASASTAPSQSAALHLAESIAATAMLFGLFGLGGLKRYRALTTTCLLLVLTATGWLATGCGGRPEQAASTTDSLPVVLEVTGQTSIPGASETYKQTVAITVYPYSTPVTPTRPVHCSPEESECLRNGSILSN